ncbi:MAG TPA: cytochrome c [Leucothrix mucor]|nr:cytochrome c [Leucothrix mucor]
MKIHLKILTVSTLLALTTWGAVSFAHSAHFTKNTRSADQSFDFRSSTMSIYKWYLSPMGAMAKGKTEFNAKSFAQYAAGLEAISKIDLLEGFPKESSEDHVDDSNAKEEIWSNWKDFENKAKNFQLEAKKLSSIAKAGNEAAIKAQFKKTAGTCGACHKKYKTK